MRLLTSLKEKKRKLISAGLPWFTPYTVFKMSDSCHANATIFVIIVSVTGLRKRWAVLCQLFVSVVSQ